MSQPIVTISPLAERPWHVEAVTRLRFDAFFKGGARTIDEDRDGLRRLMRAAGPEIALVAESGPSLAGTCLLVSEELEPMHDVSPWLAGLVVGAAHRRAGIGGALVRAIEAHASAAGIAAIFLHTASAEPFYRRLGWTVEDRRIVQGKPLVLMQRLLHP